MTFGAIPDCPIVAVAGEASDDAYYARAARILAERLDCPANRKKPGLYWPDKNIIQGGDPMNIQRVGESNQARRAALE